jgi:putative endopeptidase
MIGRFRFVVAALLVIVFPAGLMSQTADLNRSTMVGERIPGGCFVPGTVLGGGSLQRPAGDQVIHGFNLANLDRSVSPCEDFFKFANSGWIKNNPIPADHSSWSTFNQLHDRNEEVLRQILEEAAKDKSAAPGSNWQKIGDFYASCMDETQIETVGLKPLEPEFRRVATIGDTLALQVAIARLQREGVNAVFGFGSEQDFKDSSQVIAGAEQGGIGLPDRQYYLQDDDRSKQLRAAYVQHVTNMFKLMGDDAPSAASNAAAVLKIETDLAKASMDRADRRDPDKIYHKIPVAKLRELTPHLSWEDYFKEIGARDIGAVNVGQPDFFKEVDAELQATPLDSWKTYLRWHLIHSVAPSLSKMFVEENFDFYGRTLTGTKELLPRWRRCVEATDHELGEALGQYYVQRNFPPAAKSQALTMVRNLMAALHDDLSTLDWMSPATREQAIKKLAAMNLKIGYPEKWRDYSALHVERGPYVENHLRGDSFQFARDVAKIGKPVDRTEWDMTPPTVNAYYNPSMNEIVFPAGILQPPFFDPNGDSAINYGGIGAVIGHEMTHGFDDQGAKFDAQGNLNDWWTPEDLKNFQARGDCIAKQFDSYEYEGLHENGKLVEGESIADLGGLTIAYAGFEKSLEGKPAPPVVAGFTADQRFFLGFAQIWAGTYRPEYARLILKTNEHPLGPFRTNGPLSNTPAFAKAFGCAENSPMARPAAQRCRIW